MASSRKPALRSARHIPVAAQIAGQSTFEANRAAANGFDAYANKGKESNGAFMRKADKNRLHTLARQIRKNNSVRGNDYRYGTREEVQAQHGARYRNIRRAFGMSAG